MQCGAMAFCTPLLQEAAYEVWLKSQKKALHRKCVSYLEGQAHKCKRCGEGDFISFHRYIVEMMLEGIESQETVSEQHKEYPLSEAASMIINTTLKKLEAPSFEGTQKLLFTPRSSDWALLGTVLLGGGRILKRGLCSLLQRLGPCRQCTDCTVLNASLRPNAARKCIEPQRTLRHGAS